MTDPLEPDLLRVLHQLPEQLGTDWQVEVIPGGMTNRNYRVRTTAADLVVRLSVPDTGQLGIDRDNEHHNSMIAARAGVGAPVIARVRVPEALVVGFVEGRTLSPSDFTDTRRIAGLADVLRRLHAAEPFAADFDMVQVQQRYHEIVKQHNYPLPEDYAHYADRVSEIGALLTRTREHTTPCHNDLMPGNFIEPEGAGGPICLLDYEYSGNNDPFYDLGDAINELELDPAGAQRLVGEYLGREDARLVARARLWALMSMYGWSLWGSIRIGTTGDEEIREWADALWLRAVREFESAELPRSIELVGGTGGRTH